MNIPLERDEGEYAYLGQLILQGIPPYQLAYSMKLPGIHAAYALIMAIFGETSRGIHVGLLLVNLATIALLFLLIRRLFDDVAAAVSVSAYAILSLSPTVLGFFAHATHFVVLPAIAGTLLLFGAVEKRRNSFFFLSGMFFGVAFAMKQHGIFFILFGIAWLILEILRQGAGAKRLAACGGWYAFGAALPLALIFAWLANAGVLKNFWFWTFEYARSYATELSIKDGIQVFSVMIGEVIGSTLPIWIFALAGLTTPAWDDKARERQGIMFLFFGFSFLSICPGFYFRDHYFVLMLPVVALLSGAAVSAAWRKWNHAGTAGKLAKVSVYGFIVSLVFPVVMYRDVYFVMEPIQVSRKIYSPNPFPEAIEIASKIRASSDPHDRVAILGSEPEIFFYSGRRSATGHIYMYGLMEPQPYASRMQREAVREIEAAGPKHVVIVNVPYSWLVRPDSDMFIFRWMEKYIIANYERIGLIDIISEIETSYVWGKKAADYQPRSPYYILLFERKTKPQLNG